MSNFEVVAEKKNEAFIKEFFKEFKLHSKLLTCVDTKVLSKRRNEEEIIVLTFNVKREKSDAFKLIFSECFASSFISVFKFNYLKENVKFDTLKFPLNEVLIKALCFFDKSTDEEVLLMELYKIEKRVVLESFFKFRLNNLEKRWNELAGLVNENLNDFLISETFIEFLKFLISSMDITDVTENVYINDKGSIFINNNDEGEKNIEGVNAILGLIKLSPRKIIFHLTSDIKSDDIKLMYELFDDKIEIVREK